jgi:hypothetical protein
MAAYMRRPSSRKQFLLRSLTAKGAVKPSKSKFLSLIGAKRNLLFDPADSAKIVFCVPVRPARSSARNNWRNPVPVEPARESDMKVTRKSLITGKIHTMELPVNPLELDAYHVGNANIQDVFPHLTPEQREFIKSGITPEEWAAHIADNEDREDSEPRREHKP